MISLKHKTNAAIFLGLVSTIVLGCSNASFPSEIEEDPNLLYHDDFSSDRTGPWHIEGDELGSTAIDGEQLTIEVRSPNTIQYATLQEPVFSDFQLEIDATLVEGAPNSTFGILFRMQESGEFYRFELMNDGHYMIEKYDGEDDWTRLVDDWTFSDSISSGNIPNRLKIVAEGSNLSFYVNGELLREVTDTALTNGYIGLDAGTFGTNLTVASFDNLVLSNP